MIEALPEERRPTAAQVLEVLFGLEDGTGAVLLEGEVFKRELFESIQAWWRARFSDRPTVVIFDDLHWCDAASIDLLRQLLPLTEEISLILVFALRSERESPAWNIKIHADDEFSHR